MYFLLGSKIPILECFFFFFQVLWFGIPKSLNFFYPLFFFSRSHFLTSTTVLAFKTRSLSFIDIWGRRALMFSSTPGLLPLTYKRHTTPALKLWKPKMFLEYHVFPGGGVGWGGVAKTLPFENHWFNTFCPFPSLPCQNMGRILYFRKEKKEENDRLGRLFQRIM